VSVPLIPIAKTKHFTLIKLTPLCFFFRQLGPISEFMINSYCDSLKETFGQLVYYGLLKEEDAQCFSVKSSIQGGSFLLAFGALLLAVLSTFVTKAVVQYLRDQGETEKRVRDEEDSLNDSDNTSRTDEYNEGDGGMSARIHPAPVLFTDNFRWLLIQENNHWDLPDVNYHWGAPASNPSRALFLPEARVLSTGPIPGQYPKIKYAEVESGAASISKDSSASASTGSFRGFSDKGSKTAGLKTTGLSQNGSFTSDCAPSRASFNDNNNYNSEGMFQDESSVSGSSVGQSASSAAARSTATTSERETTTSEHETVDEEEDEYDEQTVDTGFDEYTVMSEEIIEEELEDVISSYESQSVRRLD
jgi:hypothetical protein